METTGSCCLQDTSKPGHPGLDLVVHRQLYGLIYYSSLFITYEYTSMLGDICYIDLYTGANSGVAMVAGHLNANDC